MEQTVVKATVGREQGSRASRRLRAAGHLPGVVYGLDKDPQPVAIVYTELRDALSSEAGMNAVLSLDVDGTMETVLVRSVQRDPIKRRVIHADFLRIDPDQLVNVKVPIELVGEPTAVLDEGAIVEQALFEIEIEASATSIPNVIEVDVSGLTLDSSIAVGDLTLPRGVTSLVAEDVSVAAPVIPRAVRAEEEAAEEAGEELVEGEEGAEAAAGDGAGEGEDAAGGDSSDEGGE